MFEFPSGLRVIEGRGVTGEFELIHQLLRFGFLALKQQSHKNVVLYQLSRLVFLLAWSGGEQSLKSLAGLGIISLLERDLGEVVLRLAEFRIGRDRFLKGRLGLVEFLLLH